MKRIINTLIVSFLFAQCYGQVVVSSGKIYYEKRTNQFNMLENSGMPEFMVDEAKNGITKILVDHFILDFDATKSLYKLQNANTENKYFTMPPPLDEEFVFKDFTTAQTCFKKNVMDKKFVVQDSLKQYTWKIMGDTREIAGFECKKAITRIYDSIYVVAFFTPEILPASGPEGFNGLPGMILQISIPRLYTSWIAKHVDQVKPGNIAVNLPEKQKKTSIPEFSKAIYKQGEDLPPFVQKILWMFEL